MIQCILCKNMKNEFLTQINTYLTSNKLENSSFKYLFKEIIAIKNLLVGNIKISNEKFDELINDKNTPRDIIIRAAKFLDTIK